MEIKEIISYGLTFSGMAFGFGMQSAAIQQLKRDTDAIAKSHREILRELQAISLKIERLDQRVIYCEKT